MTGLGTEHLFYRTPPVVASDLEKVVTGNVPLPSIPINKRDVEKLLQCQWSLIYCYLTSKDTFLHYDFE